MIWMIKVLHKPICLFWYNINDHEFILKVSSQNCKCNIGLEKDIEYNIDVEFRNYRTRN